MKKQKQTKKSNKNIKYILKLMEFAKEAGYKKGYEDGYAAAAFKLGSLVRNHIKSSDRNFKDVGKIKKELGDNLRKMGELI